MNRSLMVLAALLLLAQVSFAQQEKVSGIFADRETASLSYPDKLAAREAERAALVSGEIVTGYEWKGPDGASGTVIVGGLVADTLSATFCRRFIHVVHHKNDGGLNPTFVGTLCRGVDGQWTLRERISG